MNSIKFFSNYTDSSSLLRRFLNNYIIDDNLINFTLNDDYDYAVVFNSTSETLKIGSKIITIIQEPTFSDAHDYFYLTNSDYLLIHDANLFERFYGIKLGVNIIETPSYMFYDDKLPYQFFMDKVIPGKDKKLSIIVSSLYFDFGNYRKRIALLERILSSDLEIDIYGRGLNIEDSRYKGSLEFKHTGLIPYEYSIAIENSNEKNYVSEKFIDCVLCDTTPIYYGAPNADEIYDTRYFRHLDLNSETVIEDIRKIVATPAPGAGPNKDIYFRQFNLYTKIKEIVLGGKK